VGPFLRHSVDWKSVLEGVGHFGGKFHLSRVDRPVNDLQLCW